MAKILALILGLGAIGAAAYFSLQRTMMPGTQGASGASQPKQVLDNFREKAHQIEVEGQRRADQAAEGPAEH